MSFCVKCGAELKDEARFCPACGQEKGAPVTDVVAQDAKENKVYGILAYFGLLVLITIFAAPKDSAYCRFHANQGLILFIADMICSAIGSVIGATLGFLGGIASSALSIGLLVLFIMGIINAAKGEMKELPIIGQFRILK